MSYGVWGLIYKETFLLTAIKQAPYPYCQLVLCTCLYASIYSAFKMALFVLRSMFFVSRLVWRPKSKV